MTCFETFSFSSTPRTQKLSAYTHSNQSFSNILRLPYTEGRKEGLPPHTPWAVYAIKQISATQ